MTSNVTISVKGLDEDLTLVVNRLLRVLDEKTRRNKLRRRFYDGKKMVDRLGGLIPADYYRLAIVLGWSAKAVDVLARRCNLEGFEWADGNLDDAGSDGVWDDNMFRAESNSAMIESLIHGVSFLVNTRGGDDEPGSLIHVKDAFNATGDWNSRRRRLDNLLSILARDSEDKPTNMCLYLDGETIEMVQAGGGWAVSDVQEHAWGVPAEALVYKPRTSRPYGSSRISRPVMSLHRAALRTVVRMEGHADFYSVPEMWLLGGDADMFTNPDGTPANPWQQMLGRIKAIPDDPDIDGPNARADVKRFQAASPMPHIEFLKIQAQQFSSETSIPVTSLGLTELVNPTSADAYVASREDLIAEAEGATDDWSTPIRRAWARALAIAANEPISDTMKSINPIWRSPLYVSKASEADAGAKILAVVPELVGTTVGYELLGLKPDQIKSVQAELEARRATNAGNQVETQPETAEGVRGAPPQGVQQADGSPYQQ